MKVGVVSETATSGIVGLCECSFFLARFRAHADQAVSARHFFQPFDFIYRKRICRRRSKRINVLLLLTFESASLEYDDSPALIRISLSEIQVN